MSKNESKKVKGLYNSSITRVRPFFRTLLKMDRIGESRLPELLRAMPMNQELAERLSLKSSPIIEGCDQKREYNDKILGTINLEKCFEYQTPPSMVFLKWSLENPDMLEWPDNGQKVFSAVTQYKRECLFGYHGKTLQDSVRKEGISLLESEGVYRSSRQWWAFEGFTEMDCLIETEHYLLGFEGKRTDLVSSSTYWFPDRNQIVRNLEVLAELARKSEKDYAFILLTENGQDPITKDHFIQSLPHDETLVDELFKHYLGCLSWNEACKATGINKQCLLEDISLWDKNKDKDTMSNYNEESASRSEDYKLLRIHGKVMPQKDNYEAKLRNDLFLVGSLKIITGGNEKYRMVKLFGYEVPLYKNQPRNRCIDLLGYDKDHNLYIIELKINLNCKPEDVSNQLNEYYEAVNKLKDNIAEEIKNILLLQEFKFSSRTIKLALIPKDFPNNNNWDNDILVCSIEGRTKTDNLAENRGTIGFVSLDIIDHKEEYLETISKK